MSERDMQKLFDLLERVLGQRWLEAVQWLRDQNKLSDIAERIAAHDVEGVVTGIDQVAGRFAAEVDKAFQKTAEATAEWLDGKIETKLIHFDRENYRAVEWARTNKLETIRAITDEQRTTIRHVLSDGLQRGDNPLTVARELKATVGLTPAQERMVSNYRTSLEAGRWSDALSRELRDGRLDRTIDRLRREGKPLSTKQVDRAVSFYRDGMHTMRAETIARTEGLRALHEGTEEMLRQAVEKGQVAQAELEREWNHANVGRYSRPGHRAMNGQRRKWGEPFETPAGVKLRYPGDPEAPPSETINCRCVLGTRLVA